MALSPTSSRAAASGSGGGAWTLINSVLLGSNGAIAFAAIPQTYNHLALIGSIQAQDAASATSRRASLQFNGDTATNYSWQMFEGASSSSSSSPQTGLASAAIGMVSGNSVAATEMTPFDVLIPAYATGAIKTFISRATLLVGATTTYETQLLGGRWASTAAITSITFVQSGVTGAFLAGSRVNLYGIT